ncbi:MAG: hypothetical protein ACOH1U_01140 [Rhodoglobus sp.]
MTLESSLKPDATYARGLDHIGQWLHLDPASNELWSSGGVEVPGREDRTVIVPSRFASWDVLEASGNCGIRVVLAQDQDHSVEFTTQVTLTRINEVVALRVVLNREISAEWLSPVGEPDLYQPGVLRNIGFDRDLVLKIGSQKVDSRFITILSEPEAVELGHQLRNDRRLPILLIHARDEASRELASALPRRMIGLLRVVTLNYATSRAIARDIPSADVPYGGALLVWPNLKIPGVAFRREEIGRLQYDAIRSRLTSRLAPLSALARGTDVNWRHLRSLVQAQNQQETVARIEHARSASDVAAERQASTELIQQLTDTADEWKALAEDADLRATNAESAAAAAQQAEDDARYWRTLYQDGASSVRTTELDLWDAVPALVSGANPDETYLALEKATEGRIVFTDRARKSWSEISYPDPADMTSKLTALARAAMLLYDGSERVMGHMDTWFKTEFELNVALRDQNIARSKTFRDFEYEGRMYDQIKHVKVRDAVKPNEVGRIHFALDPVEGRIIVNHVALKLYGI